MLDPARDDDELALFERDGLVTELDSEPPLYPEKHLIFMVVVMPYELTLELNQLDQLSIEFACNVRLPVLVDEGEFGGEINFVHSSL